MPVCTWLLPDGNRVRTHAWRPGRQSETRAKSVAMRSCLLNLTSCLCKQLLALASRELVGRFLRGDGLQFNNIAVSYSWGITPSASMVVTKLTNHTRICRYL